jgi:lauroyl/myristoyl acyltransferase
VYRSLLSSWQLAAKALPPKALGLYLSLHGSIDYLLAKELRARSRVLLAEHLNIPQHTLSHQIYTLQICQNLQRWSLPIDHSYWRKSSIRHELVDDEHIRRCLSEGKGVILLVSHFGPWLFLQHQLELRGLAFDLIYPLGWPHEPRFDMASRMRFLRQARQALANNSIVGMMGDVGIVGVPGLGRMMELPFLGMKASFPIGGAVLAMKTSSPLVPVFPLRQADGRHSIICTPPINPGDYAGTKSERAALMLGAYARRLEQMIRKHPQNAYSYLSFPTLRVKEKTHTSASPETDDL